MGNIIGKLLQGNKPVQGIGPGEQNPFLELLGLSQQAPADPSQVHNGGPMAGQPQQNTGRKQGLGRSKSGLS